MSVCTICEIIVTGCFRKDDFEICTWGKWRCKDYDDCPERKNKTQYNHQTRFGICEICNGSKRQVSKQKLKHLKEIMSIRRQ